MKNPSKKTLKRALHIMKTFNDTKKYPDSTLSFLYDVKYMLKTMKGWPTLKHLLGSYDFYYMLIVNDQTQN